MALSTAQTTSNIQTANALAQLNRINQATPWGSTTYTRTPGNPPAAPANPAPATPTPNATLSAQTFRNSDGSTNQQLTTGQLDNGVTQDTVAGSTPDGSQGNPSSPPAAARDPNAVDQWSQTTVLSPQQQALFDQQQALQGRGLSIADAAATGLSAPQTLAYGAQAPTLATGFANPGVPVTSLANQNGQIQYGAAGGPLVSSVGQGGALQYGAAGGPIQNALDFSGAPAMPQDNTAAQEAVVNALYGQATSRLDPQWQQDQTRLETQLANQGVVQNSDAWNKAMTQFQQGKTDAYGSAMNSAIGAGTNTLATLSGLQLANRQQGVNEATTAGNFANSAEAQLFGQNATNVGLNNAAAAQQFGQNLSAAQLTNAAEGQLFGQNATNVGLNNAGVAQASGQDIARGTFANAAAGQGFAQNQAQAAFGNSAQQQNFTNAITNAGLNNSASAQALQSLLAKYGLGGGGVTMPAMPGVPSSSVAPTDVIGAQGLASNNAMALYQQQMQNNSAAKGGAGSLLGTAAMAAMAFSDRRLKTDIQRIGTAKNGLPIYSFRYLDSDAPQIGLMAQDVEKIHPAAVHTIAGFRAVEYPAALAA